MPLFTESADVSVRPAVPGDEVAVTRVQLAAWHATHTETLGRAVLEGLDAPRMTAAWAQAIATPPGAGYRVLVACTGPEVVGVAAVVPVVAADPDGEPGEAGGELSALEVHPDARRAGHGSRLLAAAVDLLREDGATWVAAWVLDGDTAREQFLDGAGLGPDTVTRVLAATPPGTDADLAREVVERRWSATI